MTINTPADIHVNNIPDLNLNAKDFVSILKGKPNFDESVFSEIRIIVSNGVQSNLLVPLLLRYSIDRRTQAGGIDKVEAQQMLHVLDMINWQRFDARLLDIPDRLNDIVELFVLPEYSNVPRNLQSLIQEDFVAGNLILTIQAAQQANAELWRFTLPY